MKILRTHIAAVVPLLALLTIAFSDEAAVERALDPHPGGPAIIDSAIALGLLPLPVRVEIPAAREGTGAAGATSARPTLDRPRFHSPESRPGEAHVRIRAIYLDLLQLRR